jgi:uncharacterized membrane-anchored protein
MKYPALAILAFSLPLISRPADKPPAADPAAHIAEIRKIASNITYRQGQAVLRNDLAKIAVPDQFRYLDAKDTDAVLSQIWSNPKQSDTLGSIVPVGFNPFQREAWMVIISYAEDGHIKDDDATTIDYSDLLKKMQAAMQASNPEREKHGYKSLELVGWAKPPHYDSSTHKFYWAKEIKFAGVTEHTLNYNIRILGRKGVLVLNAVAPMSQLAQVEAATPEILSMVDYQAGSRYADFNSDTDKVATYGLAALVAGGVAAKAGLLKLLWVGVLALKKFIIVGLIAAAASFKKFIAWVRGRKHTETIAPTPTSAP